MPYEVNCLECGSSDLRIGAVDIWVKEHAGEAGVEILIKCAKCGHEFIYEKDAGQEKGNIR